MNILSRIIGSIFLLGLLFSLNGCMTDAAVHHAAGTSIHQYPSASGGVIHYEIHTQPHPAYYGLLPLTIPADIITSPFQLGYYLWYKHGRGPYTMHNPE